MYDMTKSNFIIYNLVKYYKIISSVNYFFFMTGESQFHYAR